MKQLPGGLLFCQHSNMLCLCFSWIIVTLVTLNIHHLWSDQINICVWLIWPRSKWIKKYLKKKKAKIILQDHTAKPLIGPLQYWYVEWQSLLELLSLSIPAPILTNPTHTYSKNCSCPPSCLPFYFPFRVSATQCAVSFYGAILVLQDFPFS